MIGALDPDAVEDVLYHNCIGRLACSRADQPYVVPITYAYQGGCIYGVTRPGRKIDTRRVNPAACFEVDEAEDAETWEPAPGHVYSWGTSLVA